MPFDGSSYSGRNGNPNKTEPRRMPVAEVKVMVPKDRSADSGVGTVESFNQAQRNIRKG